MSDPDRTLEAIVTAAQALRQSRAIDDVVRLTTLCWQARQELVNEAAGAAHAKWRKAVGLPETVA